MRTRYDLSQLTWQLTGWTPYLWQFQATTGVGDTTDAQVVAPAKVPGSVQRSLRAAGLLPDWNVGLNAQQCEWVENRHWIYETVIPDSWIEKAHSYRLSCLGLDYNGSVMLNGKLVGEFCGTHVPYMFDLTPHLVEKQNALRIVFDLPPRWLGQFGFTSRMKEWKVRFNYTWDWIPRLVQIGIWDSIFLEATVPKGSVGNGQEISELRCVADAEVATSTGVLEVSGKVSAGEGAVLCASLSQNGCVVREEQMAVSQFADGGLRWDGLPVQLWWPNMEGDQPLYDFHLTLLDKQGNRLDEVSRRVGFRNVTWTACAGAPAEADPWICLVNGRPIFLQGVNFSPILPNFADVTQEDYRKRLELYRDLGMNALRINACGFLELECFYDLCDELGLMVWQEFPLTSSGVENIAPDEEKAIDEMSEIARSFIARRQHHASLIIWSGGNELIDLNVKPLDASHPMLGRLQKIVQEQDPTRRFLATSPSGPRAHGNANEFGRGLHWDVHGPWKPWGDLKSWTEYWQKDDALFRSELGSPGASSVELIRQYLGDCEELPVSNTNPFWRRPVSWWVESDQFMAEHGRTPNDLEEYVAWSQQRQAQALTIAVKACKDRFPHCGGVLLWMGHDCFPCPTNTSIVDFHGEPKPAALALKEVLRMRAK